MRATEIFEAKRKVEKAPSVNYAKLKSSIMDVATKLAQAPFEIKPDRKMAAQFAAEAKRIKATNRFRQFFYQASSSHQALFD
jgi:hypothetical protein